MNTSDTNFFVPFVLTTVVTEDDAPIKDAAPLLSKPIEFAIPFIIADMDKKNDEEIIGLTKIGWPFWTFLIDTNYGYFVDGLQIASETIQITSPPRYNDLKKLNVEMDKYVNILKTINSELSKRRPKKEKLKISGFFKLGLMELLSSLFRLAKKFEIKENIPITPLTSQNAAKEYTTELDNLLLSIDKNLQEFEELKQEVLTSSANWVENITKTSKIQEENYNLQINQMITQVNEKISEYTAILENKIHQLHEEKQKKINREINNLREDLEPHINVLRLLYVEVRDTFKEIKDEQFAENVLNKIGTMVKFANKDAKKIEDIVRMITYSYENCRNKIAQFNEEFESKKEKFEKKNSEKIEMEKEKVERLNTEKQKKLEELELLRQKLLQEITNLRETLNNTESTLQSTQWTPLFLFKPKWIEKVNENKRIYIPLVLIKYVKIEDRNKIRFSARLPIIINLNSKKTLKEQISSTSASIQKQLSDLNRMLDNEIKGNLQLQKIFDDALSQLNFISDETRKEAVFQGLFELKEKNLISEEAREYHKRQFDKLIQREPNKTAD
ncbi:MAG: hypothetical protein ACFFCD_12500 [Promethearchaeota archaeon]